MSKLFATTYIHCSADTSGEWHAVGAALAGSHEKDAVYQELLDGSVQLFAYGVAAAHHLVVGRVGTALHRPGRRR